MTGKPMRKKILVRIMTCREAYQKGIGKLEDAGIKEASLDAWYLFTFVTGISRASYLADSEKAMKKEDEARYFEVVSRRAKRIPLQHITGVQEFMGLEFAVNEHVLIPRQDTEVLVETALSYLERCSSPVRILDLCTGSGCILLSLLYYAGQKTEITGVGADISREALKVAERNQKALHLDAELTESDLFTAVKGRFDLITSNPPYIPTDVIETLDAEVREHDPRLALDGKADGLYFYRKIVKESKAHLMAGGRLIFEIGSEQGKDVASLMKANGFTDVTVKKDLAGLDRVVSGVYDSDSEEKGF